MSTRSDSSSRGRVPIHYDYPVFKSPLSDFVHEVEGAGLQDRIVYLRRGATHDFVVPGARGRVVGAS